MPLRFPDAPPIVRRVHPEVEKLIGAGRIPQSVGERLDELAPGKFCLHKAWGAGKSVEWDLLGGKVTIDFEKKPAQVMGLKFAIEKTEPLPPDDFRARKVEEIEELRAMADDNPVDMVVHLLQSHGGAMTSAALEKELCPAVVPAEKFKRWWTGAKRALRESRRVVVPGKRTEKLVLRSGDLTPAQELLADFEKARDLKSMIKALEAIADDIGLFDDDAEAMKQLLADIDDACRKGVKLHLGEVLELLVLRDRIIGEGKALETAPGAMRLHEVILAEAPRISEEVSGLTAARQRAIFAAFPEAFGDEWVDLLVEAFDKVGSRGCAEIAKIVGEHNQMDRLKAHLKRSVARRSLGQDALIWICRERKEIATDAFGPEIGAAILNLLEEDQLADGPRKTTRLQSFFVDHKNLLPDLVATMDVNEARNFGRRLMDCPVFGELDRKSLMARVIKAQPETQDLVSGEGKKKRDEELLVSWESLEKRQAEFDDLVRNRLPQNTRDIAIARSYGDLRENFEYKAAKQMQAVLQRRKTELQKDIDRARGTDFKGMDCNTVNIGTIVTLVDENGERVQWSVLGAWDSDPEHHKISYLTEFGAALLGASPGDHVEARDPISEAMKRFTIESITPYNP